MNVPDQFLYTQDHEWVEVDESTNSVRIGITDFAQNALGDVVFVQTPAVGTQTQVGITVGEVESSKSVSDLYAPVSGTITSVNEELVDTPQRVNDDPYGRGWVCTIEVAPDETMQHLLTADAYKALIAG